VNSFSAVTVSYQVFFLMTTKSKLLLIVNHIETWRCVVHDYWL